MARTIPRQRPRSYPLGSYTAVCGHCGGSFPSHTMRREATGTWACADGQGCWGPGDAATLAETMARDAAAPRRQPSPPGPTPSHTERDYPPPQPFDPSRVLP